MKIEAYVVEKDKETIFFEMNEAYFRFDLNLWSRFDDQGENNDKDLSDQQRVLVQKLTTLSNGSKPIFRKVLFSGNGIWVTILIHNSWDEELIRKVKNMIMWSWPEFFITNP